METITSKVSVSPMRKRRIDPVALCPGLQDDMCQ
jgi:hypothetical protein